MGLNVRITEAEAVRDMGALLERVRTQGISVEILRGEEVVARLSPPESEGEAKGQRKIVTLNDLIEAIRNGPRLDPEDSLAFERDLADIRKGMPMQNREWD